MDSKKAVTKTCSPVTIVECMFTFFPPYYSVNCKAILKSFQMVVILLYVFSIVVVLTVTKSGEDTMDNEEL